MNVSWVILVWAASTSPAHTHATERGLLWAFSSLLMSKYTMSCFPQFFRERTLVVKSCPLGMTWLSPSWNPWSWDYSHENEIRLSNECSIHHEWELWCLASSWGWGIYRQSTVAGGWGKPHKALHRLWGFIDVNSSGGVRFQRLYSYWAFLGSWQLLGGGLTGLHPSLRIYRLQ